MVCVPCIVIPLLLWVFHKFLQPMILKFYNPWEKKSVEQKDGSAGLPKDVDQSSTEYKFVQKCLEANPVMVFSKTTCNYCKMAKDLLDKVGVNYTTEEIDKREDCQPLQDLFQKITGERTVPRVFVGGKCVGGGTDVWTMHNQDKLVPMMKESGATFKKTD